jgi:hypothetical protein
MLHFRKHDASDHASDVDAFRPDPLSSLVWQHGLPHGTPRPAVIHAPRAGDLTAPAETAATPSAA